MRSLSALFQKKHMLNELDILFILILTYWLLSKYFFKQNIILMFKANFLKDLDLTASTDFEDLLVIASDVFEVIEHDRLLAMDGISDLFIARGFFTFSSSSSSTIR